MRKFRTRRLIIASRKPILSPFWYALHVVIATITTVFLLLFYSVQDAFRFECFLAWRALRLFSPYKKTWVSSRTEELARTRQALASIHRDPLHRFWRDPARTPSMTAMATRSCCGVSPFLSGCGSCKTCGYEVSEDVALGLYMFLIFPPFGFIFHMQFDDDIICLAQILPVCLILMV